MPLLFLAIPLLLPLIGIISIVIPIYLFAKAKGDIKGMSSGRKKFFIASALFPIILLASTFIFLGSFSSSARNKLADDIKTGALTVYKVDDTDTSHTQTETFKDASGAPYLSFNIFANKLYAEQKDADINIRTNEFQGNSQIKQNSIGFVRFLRHGSVLPDANGQEAYLKKKGTPYTRTETSLGTVFESQEKDTYPNSGRFLYEIYFANSDYSMLISVSYNSEEDLRVRYSPVVSREYAQKLYDLIKSTVKVDPSKLPAVYNLQAM